MAFSTGGAFFGSFRAAVAGAPVHTIGSHLAHVPQALTPRSPTDDRALQPATLPAADPSIGWVPIATSNPAIAAGTPTVLAARPQPRAPPAVTEV